MARSELASGVILALAGLVLAIWVIPMESAPGDEGEIAPGFMPSAAAITLVLLGALLALSALRADAQDAGPVGWLFLLGAAVGLAASVGVIAVTGFKIGGAVTVATLGFIMGARGAARWWMLAIAIALPVLTHTLAWHGLRLALP